MLYWNTGNRNIAAWLAAPETIFLLDFVRPDFLMLRTLARGLVLWDRDGEDFIDGALVLSL